jgi:hypothetical protein
VGSRKYSDGYSRTHLAQTLDLFVQRVQETAIDIIYVSRQPIQRVADLLENVGVVDGDRVRASINDRTGGHTTNT